jgi:hypothetical protein
MILVSLLVGKPLLHNQYEAHGSIYPSIHLSIYQLPIYPPIHLGRVEFGPYLRMPLWCNREIPD